MQNEGAPVSFIITINEDKKGDSGNDLETYVPRFIQPLPNQINKNNASMVQEIEIHGSTPKLIGAKTKRRGRDQPYKAPPEDYGKTVYQIKFEDVRKDMAKYPSIQASFEEAWERKNERGDIVGTFIDDLAAVRKLWGEDKKKLERGKEPDRYKTRYNVPRDPTKGFSVKILYIFVVLFYVFHLMVIFVVYVHRLVILWIHFMI